MQRLNPFTLDKISAYLSYDFLHQILPIFEGDDKENFQENVASVLGKYNFSQEESNMISQIVYDWGEKKQKKILLLLCLWYFEVKKIHPNIDQKRLVSLLKTKLIAFISRRDIARDLHIIFGKNARNLYVSMCSHIEQYM